LPVSATVVVIRTVGFAGTLNRGSPAPDWPWLATG